MNACLLQEEIIKNPQHIVTILERLGHENIRDRGSYFQARNINGDNDTGCAIKKDSLIWSNFSHGKNGSIFTMIQDESGCSFPDALHKAAKWIGYKDTGVVVQKPFGGFWSNLLGSEDESIIDLPIYEEECLPSSDNVAYNFVRDGISAVTQSEYGVRYDHETNGIIIPWRNTEGKLIGAKWRNNDRNCDFDQRWNMYKKFQMSQAVYGWFAHYRQITAKRACVLFESEKSVLQGDSFDWHLGLAVGGHNISRAQVQYIKNLYPNKVIVGFDAGLNEEEIRYNASKLLPTNDIIKYKVGYIYDKEGRYLKNKMSPTDGGRKLFEAVVKECVVYL